MAPKTGRGAAAIAGISIGAAAGIAFGTYILAPNLAGGSHQREITLTQERDDAVEKADIADAQASGANGFIAEFAPSMVRGTLDKRPVLVFVAHDADKADVAAMEEFLDAAGATKAGTITLTEQFFSQDGADGLKNIVANTLPAGVQLSTDKLDAGTHAGEVLGSALMLAPGSTDEQASAEDRAILLGALQEAGFIEYDAANIVPAQAAVIIHGDSDGADEEFAVNNAANFARALDSRGGHVVVTGRVHTASDTGVIGKLRADGAARNAVSTVDSIDRTFSQVAAVLAVAEQLQDRAGAYGAAASADAVSPAPPSKPE